MWGGLVWSGLVWSGLVWSESTSHGFYFTKYICEIPSHIYPTKTQSTLQSGRFFFGIGGLFPQMFLTVPLIVDALVVPCCFPLHMKSSLIVDALVVPCCFPLHMKSRKQGGKPTG